MYPRWGPVIKERNTRSKHSNVRTGCITCKARHKKCDEAQPACQNCINTGRLCDGYAQVLDKRTRTWRDLQQTDSPAQTALTRHHYKSQRQPLSFIYTIDSSPAELSWNDRWYLNHFRKRTAVQFSGYFEDEFWSYLVLQMCEGQPAIRHAVIAMSAWQCQFETGGMEYGENRENLLPLGHAHKSIACLREHLTRHKSSRVHIETVLVTCILLMLLALIQGDIVAARCHLLSGYNLFKEWEAIDYGGSSNWKALKYSFSRLHIAFSISADPKEFNNDEPFNPLESDEDKIRVYAAKADELERHRSYMMVLRGQMVENHPEAGFMIKSAGSAMPHSTLMIMSKMRLWRGDLLSAGVTSPMHRDLLALFDLYTLIMYLRMSVDSSPEPTESLFDEYLKSFQHVVLVCKSMLRDDSNEQPATFCYIKETIAAALFWCGVKCRDYLVRDEIVSLLDSCKADTPWVSAAMLALHRVIQIESNGVEQGDIIPAVARVQGIDVKEISEGSKIQLSYSISRNERCSKDEDIVWENEILFY
ncbi:hypothetical protein MYU51_014435 [Penicillium brevicompactum]